ncbi:hypothetical protein ACFQZK_17745 [Rhodococcus aetherivorans]
MGTAQAAVIGRERLQLVLGDEVGVTAREVSVDGERIRLGAADLRLAARVLRENGVEPVDFDALVVVSTDHETVLPFGGGHDEVTVEILGVPDGPLAVLRTLDPRVCVAMLAEATAAAWRQRLSDAADAAGQVTSADVEAVGPIAIPGAPTLTELRSERRRLLAKEASERTPNGTDPQDSAVLDEVIADLRAAVRFGAAGLVDTPDDQLAKGLASAAAEEAGSHACGCCWQPRRSPPSNSCWRLAPWAGRGRTPGLSHRGNTFWAVSTRNATLPTTWYRSCPIFVTGCPRNRRAVRNASCAGSCSRTLGPCGWRSMRTCR